MLNNLILIKIKLYLTIPNLKIQANMSISSKLTLSLVYTGVPEKPKHGHPIRDILFPLDKKLFADLEKKTASLLLQAANTTLIIFFKFLV